MKNPIQRIGHGVDSAEPVGRVGAKLGNHRIIVDRNLTAFVHACIITNSYTIA